MKRIFLLILATGLIGGEVVAQEQQAGSFTLDKCIEYALRNSVSAQNAILDQDIAKARVRETTGLGLPQVSASVGLQYNQKLARFFGRYSDDPNSFSFFPAIPGVNNGDILAANNFFQLQGGGDASVSVNQLIFNGSYFVGLQASAAFKELSYKNTAVTQRDIMENVTKAYYGVLINNERARLFDINIARVDSLLRNTKALQANGFAETIDVDRIQVTYNNLISDRNNFDNLKKLSLALLKFQMNFPMDQDLVVEGSIQDLKVESTLETYKEGWDYKNRPDYQVLESNRKLQALNLKNQYAGALPTIAAFGKYGYSTQSPTISGLFKTNTNIKDGGGVGPDKWYNYSLFGVSLSWDLFTGLQRNYKIQQEKLTLQKIENSFRQMKAGIDLEIEQSSIAFENALRTLTSQKQNMELATNIARVTRIKFEQGVGSNLEVVDAESSLKTAQNNYYSALYDAMIAKVDLDVAYGKMTPPTATENK